MPICPQCNSEFAASPSTEPLCPACFAPAGKLTPFSIPASVKEHRGTPVILWVVLASLGLLVSLVVAAESGAVTSETHETKWTSEGRNESEFSGARGRPPLFGVRFNPTVTISVPRGSGHDIATKACAALKKAGGGSGTPGPATLDITITQATAEGNDWLPFSKSGTCKFAATYSMKAETSWSEFAGRGEVKGTITQNMSGFCSRGLFQEKMGEAMAQAILSDIGKLIAKYS